MPLNGKAFDVGLKVISLCVVCGHKVPVWTSKGMVANCVACFVANCVASAAEARCNESRGGASGSTRSTIC